MRLVTWRAGLGARLVALVVAATLIVPGALPVDAQQGQPPVVPPVAPAAITVAPTLSVPAAGAVLPSLEAPLAWSLPPGATQEHLQVTPINNDGPGVNLIRNASGQFTVPPPPSWYVLLPGMSYTWRVRTTKLATPMSDSSPGWDEWSPLRRFRTPAPTAATLRPVAPADAATVAGTGALSLQWADSNTSSYYYEVQVSGDTRFDPNPASASSFVYWNLVHGGITTPPNSWAMPSGSLTAKTTYYWRVRPRVQGDGAEVAWGPIWSFQTP